MGLKVKDNILLNILIFLTFDLMLLGAGVRTMDAGLTCPDWPLCFGKAIPNYHFGVYLEFIHRAIAGLVGLLYLVFFVQVLRRPRLKSIRLLAWVGLFFLVAQIIMGGLTVLKLLEAYIVTLHLTLATAFLLVLFVMKKILSANSQDYTVAKALPKNKWSLWFRMNLYLGILFVFVQIILGGLVATTYSGLVCIDFPTCNGQYFPELKGPIGIQMIHRFGAYWLSFLIVILYLLAMLRGPYIGLTKKQKVLVAQIFMLLVTQVFVGVMNLKYLMPAFLSVFHLFLALMILLSLVRLYFSLVYPAEHRDEPSGLPRSLKSSR